MDAYALEAKEKMGKCIESYRATLSTLRTGRASPAMLNGIEVDYYGSPTPINQISSISVPEPRQLLIKPYDRNDVKNIVSAISASDLGLNPINEGVMVRLIIPALTEDRRKEIVKTYPAVAIEQGKLGFVGVGFPSPEEWYYTIKAALTTGETVYTRIKVEEKLKPGEKRILEIKMNESGTIGDQELQQNMGMSVITTWKEGHTYEPSI